MRNVVTENGGHVAGHGVCGSPLIDGNFVVVAPTGKSDGSLVAYDRVTGKPAWHSGLADANYATPMLASVAGREQILNYDDNGLTAHDPQSGKVLWHFEWNVHEPICSQPIADAGAADQVLLTVGYGRGSALLKVAAAADGNWSATPVWESKTMKTKFTTAVAKDGYVYGLDDGIMQCIDLKTGRQKWKGGRYEHGQILLVGDLIIVQTEPGPVVLIEANPKHLTELGTVDADSRARPGIARHSRANTCLSATTAKPSAMKSRSPSEPSSAADAPSPGLRPPSPNGRGSGEGADCWPNSTRRKEREELAHVVELLELPAQVEYPVPRCPVQASLCHPLELGGDLVVAHRVLVVAAGEFVFRGNWVPSFKVTASGWECRGDSGPSGRCRGES